MNWFSPGHFIDKTLDTETNEKGRWSKNLLMSKEF